MRPWTVEWSTLTYRTQVSAVLPSPTHPSQTLPLSHSIPSTSGPPSALWGRRTYVIWIPEQKWQHFINIQLSCEKGSSIAQTTLPYYNNRHTHTHMHMHVHMHTHIHTCTCACTCTCTDTLNASISQYVYWTITLRPQSQGNPVTLGLKYVS